MNASNEGFPLGWYPHPHEAQSLFGSHFEELGFESLRGLTAGREAAVLSLAERDPDQFAEVMTAVRATAGDPAVLATGAHAVWIGCRPARPA